MTRPTLLAYTPTPLDRRAFRMELRRRVGLLPVSTVEPLPPRAGDAR